MNRSNRHRRGYLLILVLGAGLAIFSAWFYLKGSGIPEKSVLVEASGNIEYMAATGKHGTNLRFKLRQDDRHFAYYSNGGKVGAVESALCCTRESITILYNPSTPHSSLFDSAEYYPVYEIRIGGASIRSYMDVRESYQRNANLAGYMAVAFSAMAVFAFVGMRPNLGSACAK